jgi:membrane associated rhomboid family serine protease
MARYRDLPIATVSLIVLNLLVFALGYVTNAQIQIIRDYGFIPDSVFNADNMQQGHLIQDNNEARENTSYSTLVRLFASIFIHASITHIVFNVVALAYIGVYAERSIGSSRYFVIYLLSGVLAALFHGIIASYLLNTGQTLLIGASGAISGILGIAAATGNRKAYYWLIFQIIFVFIGSVSSIPIAFTAHIGGFLAGVILTKFLVKSGDFRRREQERMEKRGDY